MNKSKIVIGTWPLSGDLGLVSVKEIYKTLEYCTKNDLNEFDTAPNYGNGIMEKYLGEVFNGDKRIIINTKCGNNSNNIKDFSYSALKKSFENSLKRLRAQSVNTLFLHNPRMKTNLLHEAIKFLREEKDNGRVKYCGISLPKDFNYDIKELNNFDSIQNDLNILYLDPIIEQKYNKYNFFARSPLATGILAGKINSDTIFSNDDYRSTWLKGKRLKSIIKRVNVIKKNINVDLPNFARQFLLQHNFPNKVIFGVKKSNHIDDILDDLNADPIASTIMNKILKLYIEDYGLSKEHKDLGY